MTTSLKPYLVNFPGTVIGDGETMNLGFVIVLVTKVVVIWTLSPSLGDDDDVIVRRFLSSVLCVETRVVVVFFLAFSAFAFFFSRKAEGQKDVLFRVFLHKKIAIFLFLFFGAASFLVTPFLRSFSFPHFSGISVIL